MAYGAMSGASSGFGGCLNTQNPPILTGLQHDGQMDTPNPRLLDGAFWRRIFERECPYHRGDAAQELPMFRFVEHFPESDQPYIGDSYGNQTFICFDEDKPCSSHCDCRQLGSQPDDFAFIATKVSTALSIIFYDSALGEVVAAVSGEAGTQNTEAWGGTTFDGLAILAQYARLKQHLELLDPGLAIVPTLRLLVDGFLADGQVFKSFGYNDLFERGYLSLELWNDFQHRQLDDDITLLDDTFNAVAEVRNQDDLGDAVVDEISAVEDMPLHPDIVVDYDTQTRKSPGASMPGMRLEGGTTGPFGEAPPPWTPPEGDTLRQSSFGDGDDSMVSGSLFRWKPHRFTTTHLKFTLALAAKRGDESEVQLLLDRGADVNSTSFFLTPLVAAAQGGHESVARLLLDRGADVNHELYLKTPLVAATKRGHESVVRLLLDRGADVNRESWSATPLEAAVEGGHESLVRLLADRGANQQAKVLEEVLRRGWNETARHLLKLGWRPPPEKALVVRMLREEREQKEAANRRSHMYMETCYSAFVEDYGRVKGLTGLRRDELVDLSIRLQCVVTECPGWKFNESVRYRFTEYRTAWQSGIRALRRVSRGELPEDPGEVLAFLCVCKAVSKTLDFFTASDYTTMFLADLGRWGFLFKDNFDCYSHLIRRVWEVDVTNELPCTSGGELLQYAQGLVSSLVGAASSLIRPMAKGGRDGLEESQQRWLDRCGTRRGVENDREPVGQEPPDNPLLETPRLRKRILHDISSARISETLLILMTTGIFAIILIFLLWLRASTQGIQTAPAFASLRAFPLPVGGLPLFVESCMVLETYLGLRSKADVFVRSGASCHLNTTSASAEQALSISPPQPGEARDNTVNPAGPGSPVQRTSRSVFSARTGEVGRRNDCRWFCEDCQRPFSSSSNYRRHQREKHKLIKVVCPRCGEEYGRQDYLARHLENNICRKKQKRGRLG